MTNKKSMKLLLLLGFAVLSLALLPGKSWAATDGDGDGFASNKDCNDSNPNVYPGATEICNSIDDDCDGLVDEDGVCAPACTDSDGDGYYAEAGCGTPQDCNDGPSGFAIHPGATEVCDNAVDENCDGVAQACCTDSDGDGFSVAYAESDCGTEDCNDENAAIFPGAIEDCDGVDNQCPGDSGYGLTDEVCSACNDDDEDGYYAEAACGTAVDCNDDPLSYPVSGGAIHPGAIELGNGVDDNCDGQIDEGFITPADSDEDGLQDSIEQSGFALNSAYELWDGSDWVSSAFIDGSTGCTGKCLNENRRDLFIAWRALDIDSRVDLSTCNIFAFAENPISIGGAEYTVWITREITVPAPNRRITAGSDQLMVLLIEDASTSGTSTGISEPGTIMVADMGRGWIRSHKIELNIDTNCNGDPCKDTDGVEYDPPYIGLKCLYKKKNAIHEVWHVLSALNTSDLHIDDSLYIMYGSVLFTQKGPNKTYYIGDQFSPAGLTDPSFQ